MARARREFLDYLRRTEGRLMLIAVATAVSAIVVGTIGMLTVHERQDLLDDATGRRGAVTAAALDVYRALADADATALDAVLVDPQRATQLQQRHREAVFDANNALREAAAGGLDGTSADRVRQLGDLLPEYVRLVETGWTNSRANQPVGTSYLAQASFLVRGTILTAAGELHREQTAASAASQRAAGRPAWTTFAAGLLALALLLAAQRYLFRRTRRRFNLGLVAATALIAVALLWLGTALAVAASHAEDSVHNQDGLVAPLAQARNLGREADGDEARLLIFPRVGDIGRLRDNLAQIENLIADARRAVGPGGEGGEIDRAAAALRDWRQADRTLLEQPNPPPTYQEVVALLTSVPAGNPARYAQQLDEQLTAAIERYTGQSAAGTASAGRALANLNVIIGGLAVLAAAAAVAGLWPRIAEYY